MKTLIVYPENIEQLEAVVSRLKALEIPFERREEDLPEHVMESIGKGISQIEAEESISVEEFKQRHFINNKL